MPMSNPFSFVDIPASSACTVGVCADYGHTEGTSVSKFQIVTFTDSSRSLVFCFRHSKDEGFLLPGHPHVHAAFIEAYPQWKNAEWYTSNEDNADQRCFSKRGSQASAIHVANLERDLNLPAKVREVIESLDACDYDIQSEIIDEERVFKSQRYILESEIGVLEKNGTPPGIAVVLVGESLAGEHYVGQFFQVCAALEVTSTVRRLPHGTTEDALMKHIQALNADPTLYGIVIPDLLPHHFNTRRVQEAIKPEKAVEGLQLGNVAAWRARETSFEPCVVSGIRQLLWDMSSGLISGRHVVVVTRNAQVSQSLVHYFMQEGATVTVCDSRAANLSQHSKVADILIAAEGKPGLITGEMVKKGAVVIDWGASDVMSSKLQGDVDAESVSKVAKILTRPLLELGPVAIVPLVKNTIKAARLIHGLDPTTTSSISSRPFLGVLGPLRS